MKEPHHPVAPAFDQAKQADEHERQRLMAGLTEQQREKFDLLRQQQEAAAKELRNTQKEQTRDKIAEKMRGHLFQDKEPHYRPDAHRHNLKDRQELTHAVRDYVEDKQTRATKQYRHELAQAYDKGHKEVSREHQQGRDKQSNTQQRERDDFLRQAQKERAQKKTKADFENASRDPSWHRAFNQAARQEAEHDRNNPHDHDKSR